MAAAAAWEVLEKTANVAQMFAMIVAVFTSLLRVQQSYKRQCAELELRVRRLCSLLQWPATGALLCSEMGGPVVMALADAAGLVNSYKKSTLWRRLRSGGRMAAELREMQDVIDSYCGLLLFVNAHLLLQQQATHHHSPSSETSATVNHEASGTSQSPSTQAVTGTTQTANDIDQGGMDNDPAAGCERTVPADLLPIVISHE